MMLLELTNAEIALLRWAIDEASAWRGGMCDKESIAMLDADIKDCREILGKIKAAKKAEKTHEKQRRELWSKMKGPK
jgi:hypothetical protein